MEATQASGGEDRGAQPSTLDGARPLVIAHRGASGERPEHTLAAYALAIEQGADVIEPDLVMSRDGVLLARHDVQLSRTTDIAERPEFAHRTRRLPEAPDAPEWYAFDFDLEELRSLRTIQPYPGRDRGFDRRFPIPTFAEVLALAREARARTGRRILVYPETKVPAVHAGLGLPMAEPLLAAIEEADLDHAEGGVLIQSFEPEILEELRDRTPLPLVQLLLPGDSPDTPNLALEAVAAFADGIGPAKGLLRGKDGQPTALVEAAHGHGLFVHPWTFRDDQLPPDTASAEAELRSYLALGIDGFFTDFPATGRRVVDALYPTVG